MEEKDILKLVEETFNEEISASCETTILGLECWIEGKDKFMESLSNKLKNFLNKNDK